MLYVEIIGGLGNQMFQFAFFHAIKKHYGENCAMLYLGRFKEVKDNNGYELNRIFSIQAPSTDTDLNHLIDDKCDLLSRIRRKLFFKRSTYFLEHNYFYNPRVLKLNNKKDIYIRGLWQDEAYFRKYRTDILNAFKFPDFSDVQNKTLYDNIRSANSVSIHIRRGDYVSNNQYANILGDVCNIAYYKNSLDYIESRKNNLTYFIFSDDIEWVKQNFRFLITRKYFFVNHNQGDDSYRDMQLMSYCKHNIIANSTFSWWGAWLNNYEDKIVIAPRSWFRNNKRLMNNHIIPDSWIKIENPLSEDMVE